MDESLQDTVCITVIATGFKVGSPSQSTMDFGVKAASPAPEPIASPTPSFTTSASSRFADEDYIPDFLKRQR